MPTLAPNLFTVPNFLSPDECRALIARGESLGFEAASVATAAGPQMLTNVRNNDRVTFEDPAYAQSLWPRVLPHLPPPTDGADPIGLNQRFRFYRYDPSQRFKGHRDGVVERSPAEKTRLTFMIYLNDDFAGGETVFYSEDRVGGLRQVVTSVRPATGTALFFAHEWWHEGAPVTSGRKYVLRSDVFFQNAPSISNS
jgi:predicted 2-oxoglutarate/Fe(II)-dependent dioxygenase YbiX